MMRLFADHYLTHVASLASPGLDELRWLKPVRPGDTLSIRVTVLKADALEVEAGSRRGHLRDRGPQSGRRDGDDAQGGELHRPAANGLMRAFAYP